MRTCLVVAILGMILTLPGICQTPQKNWKDRAEFDLASRSTSESNPEEQLKLLLEWRRTYPESDFTRERQSLFLRAYDAAGMGDEVFSTASEMLRSDPSDGTAMLMLCSWAPRLKAPPDGTAALVRKVAADLLNRLDEVFPASRTRREMGSFLDSIETGQPARTRQSPDAARQEQRDKAEAAARQSLEWAKGR